MGSVLYMLPPQPRIDNSRIYSVYCSYFPDQMLGGVSLGLNFGDEGNPPLVLLQPIRGRLSLAHYATLNPFFSYPFASRSHTDPPPALAVNPITEFPSLGREFRNPVWNHLYYCLHLHFAWGTNVLYQRGVALRQRVRFWGFDIYLHAVCFSAILECILLSIMLTI